ncbi:MAG: MFS transporter [Thermoplasmataceae archaeon]
MQNEPYTSGMQTELRTMPWTIYASRGIYGMNWFSIAPGLPYIISGLGMTTVEGGLVATSFYLGIIPFQVLGGVLSSKFGNITVSISGIAMLGIFTLLSSAAHDFTYLFTWRFLAGSGSALFSSPALAFLSSLENRRSLTMRVGLYNAAFSIGSALGIVFFTFTDATLGWRTTFLISGLLALASVPFLAISSMGINISSPSRAVRNYGISDSVRGVWRFSLSAAIAVLSEAIIGQVFILYSERHVQINGYLSGITVTVYMLVGFVGGILWGRYFMKSGNRNAMFLSTVFILSVTFFLIPFLRTFTSLLAIVSLDGVLTAAILSMTYSRVIEGAASRNRVALALGFNNFLQKVIAFGSPALFIMIGVNYGYGISWDFFGVAGLVCLLAYPMERMIRQESEPSQLDC